MTARILVCLAALLLLAPAAGSAPRLSEMPGIHSVQTDGERFAFYGGRFVDTLTGRRREIAKGCSLRALRGGRALLSCGADHALQDVRSGAARPLPAALTVDRRSVTEIVWFGLGRRWMSGSARCHARLCSVYLDVGLGRARIGPVGVADLDAAGLQRRYACDAQRRLDARLRKLTWPRERLEAGLLLVPWTGYWRDAPGLYLRGCPTRRVLSRAHVTESALGGGLAVWHTGNGIATSAFVEEPPPRRRGALWLANASDGRRIRWTLPRTKFTDCEGRRGSLPIGTVAHTRYRVFWNVIVRVEGSFCDPLGGRAFSATVPPSLRRAAS